jgi:penicillin-binding protein 1A
MRECDVNAFSKKKTSELSPSESQTLLGTLKAPHGYNPRLFPERSQFVNDVVLRQMENDYIDAV